MAQEKINNSTIFNIIQTVILILIGVIGYFAQNTLTDMKKDIQELKQFQLQQSINMETVKGDLKNHEFRILQLEQKKNELNYKIK